MACALWAFFSCAEANTATLESVRYGTLSDGRVSVVLGFTGDPGEPKTFRMSGPHRVVLDFFGVRATGVEKSIAVKRSVVDSIVTIDTQDRTRVIFNLLDVATFEQQVTPNSYTVIFGQSNVSSSKTPARVVETDSKKAASNKNESAQVDSKTAAHEVTHVDFRRGPGGSGRVSVRLGDGVAGVDVREMGDEIVLEINNAALSPGLEKRLDVIDFATPVHYVDAFNVGTSVRIVVSAELGYQQSAYQVADTFTLDVSVPDEGDSDEGVNEFGYSGNHISLEFQKIPISRALDIIQRQSEKNFVISSNIQDVELTIRLIDVPWDQALDIILQTNGLAQRVRGDVVWIAPSEEIAKQEQTLLEASQATRQLEALVSELIPINYAKAADIAAILKSVRAVSTGIANTGTGSMNVGAVPTETNSLLSERGSVSVDTRTNALLVQDTALKIREIRKLITALDKPVKQVLIETRIVEATDSFSRNIGVRLGFTPIKVGSDLGTVIGSGTMAQADAVRTGGVSGDSPNVAAPAINLAAGTPSGAATSDRAGYAISVAKAGADYAALIDLEIEALESESQGKVIANPRLLTADKKEAKIEQGEERMFFDTSGGQTTSQIVKAVLGLTVTPQITPDDRVILDVYVTKDTWLSSERPHKSTKQVTTQVLLDNGETVIIGGIYEEQLNEDVAKVPVLGDVPILGALFRKKTFYEKRTEVLVFLTPRIIKPVHSSN